MKNRILFAIGGVVFGVLLSAPVQDWFKLAPATATAICAVAGLIVGILVGVMADVFAVRPEEPKESEF